MECGSTKRCFFHVDVLKGILEQQLSQKCHILIVFQSLGIDVEFQGKGEKIELGVKESELTSRNEMSQSDFKARLEPRVK